jgi:hypothetical protein
MAHASTGVAAQLTGTVGSPASIDADDNTQIDESNAAIVSTRSVTSSGQRRRRASAYRKVARPDHSAIATRTMTPNEGRWYDEKCAHRLIAA